MKNAKRLIIAPAFIGASLMMTNAAQAGAWTAKKGDAYTKYAINTFATDSFFGENEPGFEEFSDLNFTFYGEYGLRDDLTLFGSALLRRLTRTDNGNQVDSNGIGDVDIGLRYNLYNGSAGVVSTQFLFKAPYLYDDEDALPLGNGQEDFEFRLLYGKALGKFGYFGIEGGYRIRLDAPVDEWRYLIEYGFNITDNLYFRTKLDGIANAQETEAGVSVVTGNPALPLQFDLGRLELTSGYDFGKNWFGEFTLTQTLYGNNTLKQTAFQFAVVKTF